jgi:hypothetical protein
MRACAGEKEWRMVLSFICQGCGKKLRTSYDVDRERGDMRMTRWYRDETGLSHFAMACLLCGCIHDTSGSAARTLGLLMGRIPLKVHGFIRLADLIQKIEESATPMQIPRYLTATLGIPAEVVDILIERRLLPDAQGTRLCTT